MKRIGILLFGLLLCFVVAARPQAQPQWVSAWQGSPTPGGTFWSSGCPSDVGLSNQTIRNLVFRVRRLSHRRYINLLFQQEVDPYSCGR